MISNREAMTFYVFQIWLSCLQSSLSKFYYLLTSHLYYEWVLTFNVNSLPEFQVESHVT